MSKKNKKKFKKHLQQQIIEEVNSAQSKEQNSKKPTLKTKNQAESSDSIAPEMQNLPLIKADLRKTGIVIAILAIAIAATIILDNKYQILLKFGDMLFKTFNIN